MKDFSQNKEGKAFCATKSLLCKFLLFGCCLRVSTGYHFLITNLSIMGLEPSIFGTKKGLTSSFYCIKPLLSIWCGRRESNPHGKPTRPSNVRVYQFRHVRKKTASKLYRLFFLKARKIKIILRWTRERYCDP